MTPADYYGIQITQRVPPMHKQAGLVVFYHVNITLVVIGLAGQYQ